METATNGERKIKQAFILGAGLGTRLRPITNTVPKVMVEIAPGKPLLEHEIELLRSQGIKDFIINTHYLPEAITQHFGDGSKFGVRIRYSEEKELLETGGALKRAEPMLDDDFLFIYGDHLYFIDTRPIIDFHIAHRAVATLVAKTSDLPEHGEILEFDPNTKRMLKTHARPHGVSEFTETRMLNSGIFALSKKVLEYIPVNTPVKFDAETVPKLIAMGEAVYAYPTKEPILDIGKPEKLEEAKKYYLERDPK